MTEFEKRQMIDQFAQRDHATKDAAYNRGLHLIRQYGYEFVSYDKDVQYYILVNNL